MAKKNKSAAKAAQEPAAAAAPAVPEASGQLQSLKDQGNKFFGLTQYAKALDCYDKAIKLLPDGTTDREDFHVKKSACLLKLLKYKEAVKECNLALEVQPASVIALKRRASAYEQQGLFKQALADMAAVNKSEASTAETKEAEKRLKDIMAGRNKPVAANGAAVRAPQRPPTRPSQGTVFTAKCTYKNETRLVHISVNVSYVDLLEQVKNKFPEAGHIVLKYVDREGDLVTITSRNDIGKGIAEIIQAAGGLNNPAKIAGLPALKIQVLEVASEAEVPQPPPEEVEVSTLQQQQQQAIYQQQVAALRKMEVEHRRQLAAEQAAQQPGQEGLEVDEWLSDFIDLFAAQTGIDPWRAEAVSNLGMEETGKGMQAALKAPEAEPILRAAAARFQESTCMQLLNWGNTHQYIASRALEDATVSGKVSEEVLAAARKEYDAAEHRFKDALGFKADFADASAALANLEFDRAKLDAGVFICPLSQEHQDEISVLEKQSPEKAQAQMTTYLAANLVAALEGSSKAKVLGMKARMESVQKLFEKAVLDGDAYAKVQEAEAAAKGKDEKEAEAAAAAAAGGPQAPQDAGDMMRIMYGNILYEWSQFLGFAGGEWRPVLDSAVELFTAAKCPQKDVRAVLRNHHMSKDLDVPAEEVEKAAEGEAAAEEAKAPEKKEAAKGLPSLEVKKKHEKK